MHEQSGDGGGEELCLCGSQGVITDRLDGHLGVSRFVSQVPTSSDSSPTNCKHRPQTCRYIIRRTAFHVPIPRPRVANTPRGLFGGGRPAHYLVCAPPRHEGHSRNRESPPSLCLSVSLSVRLSSLICRCLFVCVSLSRRKSRRSCHLPSSFSRPRAGQSWTSRSAISTCSPTANDEERRRKKGFRTEKISTRLHLQKRHMLLGLTFRSLDSTPVVVGKDFEATSGALASISPRAAID